MDEKKLKRLRRVDLLNMLVKEVGLNEKLKEENQQLRDQVSKRRISMENSESLADAALRLSGIFEAAQAAADQYLDNVKNDFPERRAQETDAEPVIRQADEGTVNSDEEGAEIIEKARTEADRILELSRAAARQYLFSVRDKSAEIILQARKNAEDIENEAREWAAKVETEALKHSVRIEADALEKAELAEKRAQAVEPVSIVLPEEIEEDAVVSSDEERSPEMIVLDIN